MRIRSRPRNRTGSVTLVGAGPGDPELLTLKALRALQQADAVLYDALVSQEVLDLAPKGARRISVGKRAGRKSCRQDDINDLMVVLAKSGKRVVRLKSGDPAIFGRTGEEIARLQAEGIPISVVPGITAASAMAAALPASLTHRDHAQSVGLVTGHSRNGGLPQDVDWARIAEARATTIFYMGGQLAEQIARRLMAEGMPADTPVAAMANISRADQTCWRGTLAMLAANGNPLPDGPPVLIGVGGVFAESAGSAAAFSSCWPWPATRSACS